MKTTLSDEQIRSYQDNGFLAVEGFLDEPELQHWRDITEDAVAKRLSGARGWEGLNNQTDSAEGDFYAKVFTQCVKLAETHEGVRKMIFDPAIAKMAATLAGVDAIRIWHDQALFKPPYGNPTAWHLDNPYWSFFSKNSISIWVALDDATLSNGCMWYIPGSHRTARFENSNIGVNVGSLFKIYPQWMKIDPVSVPARAGTAVFHNGLTAHGAGANMTNKPRRAMTCAYMPDGSTFNGQPNVLPKEYREKLTIGDLLNDDAINPLVWSKKQAV
jgi:ectoine hydroxylase-related dioxygenase (phytanoyl-CoA dioxygenase family)